MHSFLHSLLGNLGRSDYRPVSNTQVSDILFVVFRCFVLPDVSMFRQSLRERAQHEI